MSQTSAPLREMVAGRLGLPAEPFQPDTMSTKIQPGDKSYFGRLVVDDVASGEDAVKHPDAASQTPRGVIAASHTMASNEDADDPNYAAQESLMVMEKGRIYAAIEADVAIDDPVFFRHTADGPLDKLGIFAPAAGTGLEQLSNARWVKGGTAAEGFAILELDKL